MQLLAMFLVAAIACLHIYIMVLEMFLWTKPLGRKAFRNTEAMAESTRVLAANQGLYNGFLAAGLLTGLLVSDPHSRLLFQQFFLVCVGVAGVYGGYTVSRRIFFVQALPALIALVLLSC